MSIQLTVDGHAVHCATGGRPFDAAKTTVILVHGAGMDHSCWALQSRWFAWNGYSVLVPDLPGHGKSAGAPLLTIDDMAAWVGRLMDAAGLNTAILVGHSMGALIALKAAADYSDRIARIALLGVADVMPVHPDLLQAAQDNDPLAYDLIVSWGHGPGAHFGANRNPGLWMLGAGRALLARNRPGVLFNDLAACNDWQGGLDAATAITCPALIIAGDRDQMTPAKRACLVAEKIADTRSVTLRDCGHMMMAERPNQTLDALITEFKI